jgi:hypothetical protein
MSSMKRVAIVQSNYIPWKGYFDLIAAVDEFVLYDDVQYTRQDWRNRNRIKTAQGLRWLTVPVKARFPQTIRETLIDGQRWAAQHARSLQASYARAPHFDEVWSLLRPAFERGHAHLSALNRELIEAISRYLGLTTRLSDSSEHPMEGSPSGRLVEICSRLGADIYLSGPAAKAYLEEDLFAQRGIRVDWFDYPAYPDYPQLWGPFEHKVSVVDLLFHLGPDAARHLRGARR